MKGKCGILKISIMIRIAILVLLLTTKYCLGQQTIQYADSIRNVYNIPEISYAIVNSKSIVEIASLGKHSISLPDTATL